jgi:serine phosphatase RsbU (regulator of sigma subunit)
VGSVAFALVVVSGVWNHNFQEASYYLRCVVVAAGGAVAVLASAARERTWRIANILQDSVLPDALPAMPGWRTDSLYRPAGGENRVGGDFYEAFRFGDDAWALVMGDVTGQGAPAAALTALMRHTLRSIATYTGSAIEGLAQLNRELIGRAPVSLATAVCVVLRELDGHAEAEIVCAGHPQPVLVHDGRAEYVGRSGPILGAFADASWRSTSVSLRPGDVLVLYSDGATDATGAHEHFGPERLQTALVGATSATDAIARVKQRLAQFEVGVQADDTAILAVQRIPHDPIPGERSDTRPASSTTAVA